jgi:chemotaxis protein MotB
MRYQSLRVVASLLVTAVLVLSAGCVSKGKFNSMQQERDALAQQQDSLSMANAKLKKERDNLAVVAEEQQSEINAMQDDYNALAAMFAEEIQQNDIQVEMLVDGIEVEIPSDVMYESGSATASVGSDGIAYAKKLAGFLADTDYFISVVGHTDNQKPTEKLAEKFPTNWDLAAARATNAVKFLVSQGCDPTNIVAVSRGEFDPVASNDTPEGRAQNRRIEVVIRQLPE